MDITHTAAACILQNMRLPVESIHLMVLITSWLNVLVNSYCDVCCLLQ